MTRLASFALRFGKFNLVGWMGAIWQLILLYLLVPRIPSIAATPLAVEIVVLHNFLWHERFTWRGCSPGGRRQIVIRLWRFQAANGLVSRVGNTALMYGLVERMHAPVIPSALAAMILCSAVNFLLADRWVYQDAPRS